LKYNQKFNRFRLKGLEKVKVEFTLVAIAHNLRKWAKITHLSLLLVSITEKIARTRKLADQTISLQLNLHIITA